MEPRRAPLSPRLAGGAGRGSGAAEDGGGGAGGEGRGVHWLGHDLLGPPGSGMDGYVPIARS